MYTHTNLRGSYPNQCPDFGNLFEKKEIEEKKKLFSFVLPCCWSMQFYKN